MSNLTIEQRMERMEAVHEVQNLVGRYEFWHVANLHRKCLQLFALDTPGVKIEMDWGVYEGKESVKRFFLGYHGGHEAENPENDLRGEMHMHLQTTPVIEIADDLQTARGVWISPGHETVPAGPGGSMKAHWIWLKYGFDFVRENGKWKIWHMSVYCTFMCPYETSWVDMEPMKPRSKYPEHQAPDRYLPHPPPWHYGVERPHVNIPAPPEPYYTFDESDSY